MRLSGAQNMPGAPGNNLFFAGTNPLLDPRFKIQGGEPWNQRPLLPGPETREYEEKQLNIPIQPQLPSAGFGNMGDLLAQGQPVPGAQRTLKEIFGDRAGGMSDIPGDVRIRRDTQFLPYDPNNYTMNDRSNPLRKYQWPYGMPEGLMPPIRPYFGRYQGPGLQGELGTGAI